MKKRASLIVKDDVQEVGYRSVILKIAQKLGLVGYVENLPDATVRIICEGDEQAIAKFIQMIKIKNDVMKVEDISVSYEEATGEFDKFIVKTGDLAYEMFQGFGTAGKYLGLVRDEVKQVGDEVKQVGEKVDSMHIDMTKSFNKLDEKYGVIFETLMTTNETLKSMNENMRVTQRELIESRKEFREEFSNSRELLAKAVDKLTAIVDRFIEGEKNKEVNRNVGKQK